MDEKIEKAMEQTVEEAGGDKKKIPKRIKEKYLALFKGKKWEKKKACIAAGIGVGFLAIVYFCGVWYYSGRFFEGTRIGSVLCENMTAEEAEQAIKNQVENYSVEIVFKDGTEKIQGRDIGYTYQSENAAQAVLEEQNAFLWPKGLFKGETYPARLYCF